MAYYCTKILIKPKTHVHLPSGKSFQAKNLGEVSTWLENNIGVKLRDEIETMIMENLDEDSPVLSTDYSFLIIPNYE